MLPGILVFSKIVRITEGNMQAQIAERVLTTTKQNVSLHANNCFKEGEEKMVFF